MLLLLAFAAVQAPVHAAPPLPEAHVHVAPPASDTPVHVVPAEALKTCPAAPVIPPELAGWRAAAPVTVGATPVELPVGGGVRAALLPVASVAYPVAPAKASPAGSSGGVFAFETRSAGRYRVALGAGAWIDVVRGGRVVPSVAHAHGPDCSPVRKMVDFDLGAGRYLLEVAGSPTPTLALMVARLR